MLKEGPHIVVEIHKGKSLESDIEEDANGRPAGGTAWELRWSRRQADGVQPTPAVTCPCISRPRLIRS